VMRKYFHFVVLLATFILLHAVSGRCQTLGSEIRAGNIVDRVVATVNGNAILQSDWEDAIRYEAFIDHRPLDNFGSDERKASLDRLIDQELLREQVQASYIEPAKSAAVDEHIRKVRKLYPGTETEQGWQATLQRYGIKEKEMETRIAQQLELMQLVEARLRAGIQIDTRSIEVYYTEKIVPQLKKSGAEEVPLAKVSTQIKELLTQQKVNDLLGSWLQSLRAAGQIRTPSTFPGAPGTQVK
jgi:hypothetical protein